MVVYEGHTPTYQHTDHLGTVQSATNASGVALFQDYYTPFGEAMGVDNGPEQDLGLTAHIRDKATGLTYMQARYYDPVVGRFLSVDPVTYMEDGRPGMFNRYSYAINDPVNGYDPDGRKVRTVTIEGSAGSIIGVKYDLGIYWGTRSDGSFDFGVINSLGGGAGIGAALGFQISGDTFGPEVFTDDISGTGVDIAIDTLLVTGELALMRTSEGTKMMQGVGSGAGYNSTLSAQFTDSVSVRDMIGNALQSINASLPSVENPLLQKPTLNQAGSSKSNNKEGHNFDGFSINGSRFTGTRSCGSRIKEGC